MRRTIMVILVLLVITTPVFCAFNSKLYSECLFDNIENYQNIEYRDIVKVVKETVPSNCIDAFLYYTKYNESDETMIFNLMIQLLAIGKWESGWKVTVSGKNRNGTVDLGYLALNSANIENEWFMSKFGPKETDGFKFDKSDLNEYYLITCINFYKGLYKIYGEDAAYCYNAGERKYKNQNIPSSTYTYKKRVSEYITEVIRNVRLISEKRIELRNARITEIAQRAEYIKSKRDAFKNILKQSNLKELILVIKRFRISVFLAVFNNYKRDIESALNVRTWNNDYVYIGYIKRNDRLAPVFKLITTGEKIVIC